jgi:hypothetical protein
MALGKLLHLGYIFKQNWIEWSTGEIEEMFNSDMIVWVLLSEDISQQTEKVAK